MNRPIRQRIAALRSWMKAQGIEAFIVPTNDPHNSEYVAPHWQCRSWLTGFDGSAGTAVITLRKAALWTDSRYFLQAAEQLEGTGIELQRLAQPGTPTIGQWLAKQFKGSQRRVAIDGWLDNGSWSDDLQQHLGIELEYSDDPFHTIWEQRPPLPQDPVTIHSLSFAGESCPDKLKRIRQVIAQHRASGILLSALDEIAWSLNLRGNDVHCVPVFVSYLLVKPQSATLYIDRQKLTPETTEQLAQCGVSIRPYTAIATDAQRLKGKILTDAHLNGQLRSCLKESLTLSPTPVSLMKSVKNEVEQEGFRRAMLRDGVALVKWLRWLKPAVEAGGETEMSIDRYLTALRAEQEHFRDISFDTIAGYGPHAAIVHYEATPESDAALEPHGLLLVDSGAQYSDGTTDVTRTIALGPLTPDERRDYTLVLKGFLHLQQAVFPEGTFGTQLDALAHQFIWQYGQNYMHGTGHGVGSYLSVHEGPHQIRSNYMPALLQAGMTVTDEPGLYQAGRHGIRIENTLLIVPAMTTEYGRFLRFEPLTLCPIDTTPIDFSLLTPEEAGWLNDYHRLVRERLSPLLDEEEKAWLAEATREISC